MLGIFFVRDFGEKSGWGCLAELTKGGGGGFFEKFLCYLGGI